MKKKNIEIFIFDAAILGGVLGLLVWGSTYFVSSNQADQKLAKGGKPVVVQEAQSTDLPLNLSQDEQFFDYPPKVQTVGETEPVLLAEETTEIPIKTEKLSEVETVKHTVAVVVMPRQKDGSAWDVGAGADIVLCGAAGCYVSNGLEKPATFYEGGAGLRLIQKAGECRDRLSCVFRDIDLSKLTTETNKIIEPVDVDYVSHSYMGGVPLQAGPLSKNVPEFLKFDNCSLKRSVIACQVGVHERSYSLWAMPEKLAQTGGREALDAVLFKGLLFQRADFTAKNLIKQRELVRDAVYTFYSKLFAQTGDVDPKGLKHCLTNTHFLTETFFVLGLADATERKAEGLILDLVGQLPHGKIRGFIQRTPQLYWAFIDLVSQLMAFSSAEHYSLDTEREGVLLRVKEDDDAEQSSSEGQKQEQKPLKSSEMLYGWKVKARAKAALSLCQEQE